MHCRIGVARLATVDPFINLVKISVGQRGSTHTSIYHFYYLKFFRLIFATEVDDGVQDLIIGLFQIWKQFSAVLSVSLLRILMMKE